MKRLDIQGLRAFAIILVILFHFYPQLTPNGYVGVDVFFVISGYLMAFLLSRPNDSFTNKYLDFIYRRCKRIVPMAYLIFALTFIIMQFWFPRLAEENRDFSLKALLFYANHRSLEEAYEEQLSNAEIVFTHYWSLAVEVQFYLLAPFIFWIATKTSPKRPAIPCVLLAIASLEYSLSLPSTGAFNSTCARLWQFMAGYASFFMEPVIEKGEPSTKFIRKLNEDESEVGLLDYISTDEDIDMSTVERQKSTEPGLLIRAFPEILFYASYAVLFLPFAPIQMPFCRAIATINTALIIWLNRESFLLSNRLMSFIGDISYSLYLVHWPCLCFGRYLISKGSIGPQLIPLFLIASVIIAIALHYSFEKYYLAWSKTTIILMSVTLLGTCLLLLYTPKTWLPHRNNQLDDYYQLAAERNWNNTHRPFMKENYRSKLCKKITVSGYQPQNMLCAFPPGNGNLTVLIVGNSYASDHSETIYTHVREYAANVTLLWLYACEVLTQTDHTHCDPDFSAIQFIQLYKPDVLFIVERSMRMKTPIEGNLLIDPTMTEIRNRLPKIDKFVKKIFILGTIPLVREGSATRAYEWLLKGNPLRTLENVTVYDEGPARVRQSEIARIYQKCIVYEWGQLFGYNSTSQTFKFYDQTTETTYFDDWVHLGTLGKQLIQPLYKQLADTIRDMLRKRLI